MNKTLLLLLLLPFSLCGQSLTITPDNIHSLIDSTYKLNHNNDYNGCFELINQLKIYLRENPSPVIESELLLEEGYIYTDLGYLDKAGQVFHQNLEVARRSKDKESMALAYYALGYLSQEKYFAKAVNLPYKEESLAFFEAINLLKELKDTLTLIDAYDAQGYLYFMQNDIPHAIKYGRWAVSLVESVGFTDSAPNVYSNLAEYYIATQNFETAEAYLTKATDWISQHPDDVYGEYDYNVRRNIGTVYLHTGRRSEGIRLTNEALNYAIESKNSYLLKETSLQLIQDAFAQNDYRNAFSLQSAYLEQQDSLHQMEMALHHERNQTMLNIGLREKEYQLLEAKLHAQHLLFYAVCGVSALLLAWLATMLFLYRQKKRFNANLREEVARQTKVLRLSNEALERFAFVASHDLRTPLRNVISFIGLIQRRLKDQNDPSLMSFINYAKGYANHMNHLLNDILTYSKIGGQKEPALEVVEMDEVLRTTLELVKDRVGEVKAGVKATPLPAVLANGTSMMRLMQNLVENAITYNDKPEPCLRIKATETDDGMTLISVHDNGIGIEADYHQKVFDMFTRLHNLEQYPGTGLGLSICKRVVEDSGGSIWLESEPGEGTTVFFTLPLAKAGTGSAVRDIQSGQLEEQLSVA
jgi:signal transduction histidine kinase